MAHFWRTGSRLSRVFPSITGSAHRTFHSACLRPSRSSSARANVLVFGALTSLALARNTISLDAEIPGSYTDPETDIIFPPSINVPAKFKIPTLSLLGAGVRKVSVLKVKVYSVGVYADLSNPALKLTNDMTPDEKIEHIVRNSACVIRIVPTRSTGYSHLRDAFMRNLQQRAQLAKKNGQLSPELEQEIQSPLRNLKSLFPSTSIDKGVPLDIYIPAPSPDRSRALVFRDLGTVEHDWVTNEFLLSYTDGAGLSPALKNEMLKRIVSM